MALEIVGRHTKKSNWKVKNGRVQFHIPIVKGDIEVFHFAPYGVKDRDGTEFWLLDGGMERLVKPPLDVRDGRYFHNTFTLDKRGDRVYLTVVDENVDWVSSDLDEYKAELQQDAPQIMNYVHRGGYGFIQGR